MATNPALPFHDEGNSITVQNNSGGLIGGKRFVAVNGSGEFDDVTLVGLPAAGARVLGVSAYDAAAGAQFTCYTSPGIVMPVVAGVAITAGAAIATDATGAAIIANAGTVTGQLVVGYALKDAAAGSDAKVKLVLP